MSNEGVALNSLFKEIEFTNYNKPLLILIKF